MSHSIAHGPFDVTLAPQALSTVAQATGIARMSLDKVFHGDLQGTSQGEMLAFRSAVSGSAGYVAMERVTGSLHGRAGSFVLQHSSSMAQGAQQQSIRVVPGSGNGELLGLAGNLTVILTEGRHEYHFEYSLPSPAPASSGAST